MRYFASLAALLVASPMAAQSIAAGRAGLHQSLPVAPRAPAAIGRVGSPPRSYWATGMIVGGVIGLLGGLQLAHGFCKEDCSAGDEFKLAIIPATVFAVVGGLIGSAIHKN